MSISKKQRKALTQWLEEHNVRSDCIACGARAGWEIHDSIIVGLDLDLKNKKAKPSQAGFFAMACKNCRYVRFFAAAPMLEQ